MRVKLYSSWSFDQDELKITIQFCLWRNLRLWIRPLDFLWKMFDIHIELRQGKSFSFLLSLHQSETVLPPLVHISSYLYNVKIAYLCYFFIVLTYIFYFYCFIETLSMYCIIEQICWLWSFDQMRWKSRWKYCLSLSYESKVTNCESLNIAIIQFC
jgi:hypothetical protein